MVNSQEIIELLEVLDQQIEYYKTVYSEEKKARESHRCSDPELQGRLEIVLNEKKILGEKVASLENKMREDIKQEDLGNRALTEMRKAMDIYNRDNCLRQQYSLLQQQYALLQTQYFQLQEENQEKTTRMKSVLGLPETAKDEDILATMIATKGNSDHYLLEDHHYSKNTDEKVKTITNFKKFWGYAIAGGFAVGLTAAGISYFQHRKTVERNTSSLEETKLMDNKGVGKEETTRSFDGGLATKNQDKLQPQQIDQPLAAPVNNPPPVVIASVTDNPIQKEQQNMAAVATAIIETAVSESTSSSLHPSCGNDTNELHFTDNKPANWNDYRCRKPVRGESCLTADKYLSDRSYADSHNLQYGCPTQGGLCCAPTAVSNSTSNRPPPPAPAPNSAPTTTPSPLAQAPEPISDPATGSSGSKVKLKEPTVNDTREPPK